MTLRIFLGCVAVLTLSHAQTVTHEFIFDGLLRDYDVHLPQEYDSDLALVIVLPGYSETKEWFRQYSLIVDHADTSGYILAIPTGSMDGEGTLSWNVGLTYCPLRGMMPTTDDVGFISAMIDSIYAHYSIDLTKVYCTGFSTGGEMAMRIAAQIGHRVAAVGSVAGSIYDSFSNWTPIRPMPLLTINGTLDNFVFYYHSDSTIFTHSPQEWSIPNMLDYWVSHNACILPPDTIDLPEQNTNDNCSVQLMSFSGDDPHSDMMHYKVVGGGHHWPGGTMNWNNGGNINRDIDGNATHWEFFQSYQNPLTALAFSDTVWAKEKFIPADGGVLTLLTRVRNPENHPLHVQGVLTGFTSGDSIFMDLLDSGTQGDGLPGDGIFGGNYTTIDFEEGFYYSTIQTIDEFESLTVSHHKPEMFTTAGPISYYGHSCSDTLIYPGEVIMVSLEIQNESDSFSFADVEVQLTIENLPMNAVGTASRPYGDIPAGGTAVNNLDFWLRIDSDCPHDTTLAVGMIISTEGKEFWKDSFQVYIQPAVHVSERNQISLEFAIKQNYPNPFNPSTTISYNLSSPTDVTLTVYDITGRTITTLIDTYRSAGTYNARWNGIDDSGSRVSTGVYFCRLQAGTYCRTIKMALLR